RGSLQLSQQGSEQLRGALPGAQTGLESALQLSPEESAFPGVVGDISTPLAGSLAGTLQGISGPAPTSVLEPLVESFQQDVIPGISSAAIRAGSPGGSGEQNLVTRAAGAFGRGATGELARTATQRAALQPGLASAIQNLGTAGAQAGVNLAGQRRQLDVQRSQVPLTLANMLMNAGSGFPQFQVPFAPPSQQTRSSGVQSPTEGAEFGSAIGSLLPIALMLLAA